MSSVAPPPAALVWVQVSILAPPPQAEAAADFLVTLTGRGVEINEDAGLPGLTEVKGFLAAGSDLPAQSRALEVLVADLNQEGLTPPAVLRLCDLPDQDWGENWRKHFKPRSLTEGLMVAPPWEKGAPGPGQRVIIIDPGQAFGTGQHESTLLCLRRLERAVRRMRLPSRLLDVGTGTGILSLAFLLLGGEKALGLDNDPLALEAAVHNADLNGLGGSFSASGEPLEQLKGSWPLITANLTAPDLIALAPHLAARLAPGGELIASGLLVTQVPEVRAALETRGLSLLEQDSMGEWASLVLG
jgi:ribosomal protein L11 methyltransferase